MRTSIALATYNGALYLPEQLQSFLNQSCPPDELVVSDDRSTDATPQILQAFAKKAPFHVKILANPNPPGATANFQHAAEHCAGQAILFSDQDDVWLPQHIARLIAPMQRDPRIVAVASNSTYVDSHLRPTGVDTEHAERFPARLRDAANRLPANQFELVLRHRICPGHGMAFRAGLLPLVAPFSPFWHHDQWVFLLAAAAGLVTYVSEPLTLHRQHDQQDVANRKLHLKDWAARSKSRPPNEERRDEEKWLELLARVRERGVLVSNAGSAIHALEQKLNFVVQRAHTRRAPLPTRVAFTMRELMLGRYHRWGRGLLTFARDLYGAGTRHQGS